MADDFGLNYHPYFNPQGTPRRARRCVEYDHRGPVHPEVMLLVAAFNNDRPVTVPELPGLWKVTSMERVDHPYDMRISVTFDLQEARVPHREPLQPPEPPEKVAARKLAKRILGYDPGAPPPAPVWGFDDGTSMDEMRVSFAKLGSALKDTGALAAKFNAQMQNSFVMLPWEEPKTKKGG